MFRMAFISLGIGLGLVLGVLVWAFCHYVVRGAPQFGTPEAPLGDLESPVLGFITAIVGSVGFSIVGYGVGARFDSSRNQLRNATFEI